MLRDKDIHIATLIFVAMGGLVALLLGIVQIDFDNSQNVKVAISIFTFFIYLLIFLVIVLFLKVYEPPEKQQIPQVIKTTPTLV